MWSLYCVALVPVEHSMWLFSQTPGSLFIWLTSVRLCAQRFIIGMNFIFVDILLRITHKLSKAQGFMLNLWMIHHPILGTQTGRVLPCASIHTTLPWIPTYPYPSIVIPYPSTYPTLPIVGKIPPPPTLSIYPTYPIHVTSAYILVPTSHYLLLHTPTCISQPYTIARA